MKKDKPNKEYEIPKVLHLMWASLILAIGFSIASKDWSTLLVSVIVLASTFYAIYLFKKTPFKIPENFITASIIFIYATLFLGEVADFYERFWWWDIVLHTGSAIGFGLIGTTILIIMFRQGKVSAHPGLVAFFGFSFAIAIGVIWEIFEFAMDQLFGMNMQKSGLVDTMWDLIVDSIGALIAATAGYFYLHNKKDVPFAGMIEEVVE